MSDHTPDTVVIPLTKGYVTVVDAIDADLAELKWLVIVDRTGKAYARRDVKIRGVVNHFHLHRVILERVLGVTLLKHQEVDHINGDSLMNQRHNLRVATRLQNGKNRKIPRNNNSGTQGVFWYKTKGLWVARITVDYKCIHLGYFAEFADAVKARHDAELKYFGEFAPTSHPK